MEGATRRVSIEMTEDEAWEVLLRCALSPEMDNQAINSAILKLAKAVEPDLGIMREAS